MNEADFIEALRSYWIQNWTGTDPVLWSDDEEDGDPDTYWSRVIIRSAGSVRPVIGRSREEHRGTIMVQMFGPRKDGPGQLERAASDVAAFWRAFRHERIKLDAPSVVGLPTEGTFNRHLVTLGWQGDMRF